MSQYPLSDPYSPPSQPPYPYLVPPNNAGSLATGVTRSRTLLFLSYRDSVPRSSSKRATATFPSFYSDLDQNQQDAAFYHDEREDHRRPLLSPSTTPRHTSIEIPPPTDHPLSSSPSSANAPSHFSDLPPRWMDTSDQVDSILNSLKAKMQRLEKLHQKHLRPGFTDRSQEERSIEQLSLEITSDLRRCTRMISKLSIDDAQELPSTRDPSSSTTTRRSALARNVQTALATKVQDVSGKFRKQQSLYLKRMKGLEVRDWDIRAAAGVAPNGGGGPNGKERAFRDNEMAVREDMELSRAALSKSSNPQSQLLIQEEEGGGGGGSAGLLVDGVDISQRSREIDEIAKSIAELAQLFQDLSNLVIDQGTLLDRIDYNVETMSREMEGAVKELNVATSYQRRSGRNQLILFLLLCIALLIAIIVIKPFWRSSSDPKTR
ncbi:t-SNARE [Violaceomyces palustris]|uniref:t-SNARE n=1 Tax=Violaceomyces palustris TaxID=1673888 RepID=A0ACD0P1L6_9BASI|nr:t-SNARE [Violaceomyces palustris]